ncbi:MAG: ribokinase [Pseudomonadota bacterium]
MGDVVILGVFVADTAYRAERMPRMGETILGNSFALGPGGKGSNQAVACARLGAQTRFLTKLGQDEFARMALRTWDEAGVTPHATAVAESYTGAAFIYVDEATGDNAIIIAPGAAALIGAEDVEGWADMIKAASVFVTQLEQPLEAAMTALKIARDNGVTTILNPAPAADLPDGMLALCDYLTPNETETAALVGFPVETPDDAARAAISLQEKGVGTPIITLGAQGAYLHGHGLVPAVHAGAVVETTGAGDAFNGALAAGLADGLAPLDAVRLGCATAGLSVTRPGTAGSMPSRAEVNAVLAES